MTGETHRVVVLAQDMAYPFELGIPSRVFAAADAAYEVVLCTPHDGPVITNAGFSVVPDAGVDSIDTADTVIVAPVDAYSLQRRLSPEASAAIARIPDAARIASICTGGFTLAAAGLLDGRRATTHWECAPLFRAWYPHVDLEENVLFVADRRVHTSAGAAAGIDLCLDLVRSDHGAAVANSAARRCVVPPFREGGQAQFIDRPIPDGPGTSTAATREWALRHLDRQLTIQELARHASVSERTLERRFVAETGFAPRQWLTRQRLDRARDLLETTDRTIDEIAALVGYASATSLRAHLARRFGVGPGAYRRAFHPTGTTAPPKKGKR
jgi:transcriptional regulator GlxA family with amidase domain